jgi:hypothetical protein
MVEERRANARQFAELGGEIEEMNAFSARWKTLASGRFERRREKTCEQKSFSQRRSLARKLRSGQAQILQEHGRALWRDNFVNDLVF